MTTSPSTEHPADTAALAALVGPGNPPLATAHTIGKFYEILIAASGREFYLAAYTSGRPVGSVQRVRTLTGWTLHRSYAAAVRALADAVEHDEARELHGFR